MRFGSEENEMNALNALYPESYKIAVDNNPLANLQKLYYLRKQNLSCDVWLNKADRNTVCAHVLCAEIRYKDYSRIDCDGKFVLSIPSVKKLLAVFRIYPFLSTYCYTRAHTPRRLAFVPSFGEKRERQRACALLLFHF